MSLSLEAETLEELIADCALIPTALNTGTALTTDVPTTNPAVAGHVAAAWSVDDACHAQVAELEAFV